MKQTAEPLNKLLKIFNESPYGRLSPDSHEAKGIKDVLDSVLASYKAELSKLIDSCEYEFLDGDWYHKDDGDGANPIKTLTLLALLEDNPTEK